jgi:hypothetical protein
MSDEAGIKIDGIESIANMVEDKKGGRKRSKKGGVKCSICGKSMADGSFEPGKDYHTLCRIQQKQRTKVRRTKQTSDSERATRRHVRRTKSPFRFRIKKPVQRELTDHERALNAANDRYEQEWFNGTLTPRSIVKGVIELGGLYNTMVKQARDYLKAKKDDEEREEEEEKNYASELVAYRCNLLIYYLLESAFVALGMGIGYYSYEHAVWTSFCIAEWIEATFPSYMRKKIQLEGQRQEEDLKTRLFRDERDRLRKIKRDLRRGYNMRNNELPESEEPEILQLPDGDGNQAAIDEWKEKMGGQNPEGPSRVNKFFGNVMDSVTGFVDQAEDGFYTTADFFADRVEGSRRALGDGVRLGFKPVTTLTGATGAQAEALNAVYPVFYVMGITLLYFYLFKNMFRHVNRKPEKPKRRGGRKKTRKKRRKTRRKSKKRKTKRRKRRKRKTKRKRRR